MPIVDVELVCESDIDLGTVSARALADALGSALSSEAGHTWVRLRHLDSRCYAENHVATAPTELPVFVTVLRAHLPALAERMAEVMAVTSAVATCVGRSPDRVHVQYAPPAEGRQAFGGNLVP